MLGLFLSVFNVSQVLYCQQTLGCINEYWAQFWLTSYADGYTRRALLGQLLRSLIGIEVPYQFINFAGMAVAFLIICFLLIWYFRQFTNKKWVISCAMLMSGPSTTLLFEVLADPLQMCFVVLLPFLFIQRFKLFAIIYGLFAACLMVLIHEAAIFIFIPALIAIYRAANNQQVRIKNIIFYISAIALVYAFVLNNQIVNTHSMAIATSDGSSFKLYETSLPSFSLLLQQELMFYFGSLKGIVYFFLKIFRVTFWPLVFLFGTWILLNDKKSLKLFILFLLISSPLYLIAHDWGRFAIYSLLLALISSKFFIKSELLGLEWLDQAKQFLLHKFSLQPTVLVLFPLLYISYDSYRIYGLNMANTIYVIAAICLYILRNNFLAMKS